jgi:hypothetical protein
VWKKEGKIIYIYWLFLCATLVWALGYRKVDCIMHYKKSREQINKYYVAAKKESKSR